MVTVTERIGDDVWWGLHHRVSAGSLGPRPVPERSGIRSRRVGGQPDAVRRQQPAQRGAWVVCAGGCDVLRRDGEEPDLGELAPRGHDEVVHARIHEPLRDRIGARRAEVQPGRPQQVGLGHDDGQPLRAGRHPAVSQPQ